MEVEVCRWGEESECVIGADNDDEDDAENEADEADVDDASECVNDRRVEGRVDDMMKDDEG